MQSLKPKDIRRLKKLCGDWALVTGATSGIGRELAAQLARAGFNLVVTGRREKLLTQLATEWGPGNGVQVIPVPGDLSRMEDVDGLLARTRELPLGLVVLNAGTGTSGDFLQGNLEAEQRLLDLNCRAVMVLAHQLGRRLVDRKGGALVLLSSMVAFQGVPHAAHYAATKAYVQSLGEALAVEWKASGVKVLCAAPGPVESGFSKAADMRMGKALRPDQVGVPILRSIGKRTTALPGTLTKVLVYNLRMLPRWAKVRVMGKVMDGFTRHQRGN